MKGRRKESEVGGGREGERERERESVNKVERETEGGRENYTAQGTNMNLK